jgi:hypothetical protein
MIWAAPRGIPVRVVIGSATIAQENLHTEDSCRVNTSIHAREYSILLTRRACQVSLREYSNVGSLALL